LLQDEAHYARNPDYIFRKIVDELVLVPVHRDLSDMDCIYTLNDVGAFVWQSLAKPLTRTGLQEAVLAEYQADPVVIAADLDAFLNEMTAIGAICKV
jgi:hypothetical protein